MRHAQQGRNRNDGKRYHHADANYPILTIMDNIPVLDAEFDEVRSDDVAGFGVTFR